MATYNTPPLREGNITFHGGGMQVVLCWIRKRRLLESDL